MNLKRILLALTITTVLILTTCAFSCQTKNSNPDNTNAGNSNNVQTGPALEERAVRAVGAIPSVVRVLFPNANPSALATIDTAGTIFNEFLNNPTASKWQKAVDAWGKARLNLLNFNNQRLNSIIAVVDILLTQVTVPEPPPNSKAMPRDVQVKAAFNEDDVKRLEELVNTQRE